ncbi:hypothetical protein QR680_003652 [Steinernema hermaphroditum]|uniref:DUF19 domain-containing protein n=1 Tax=Steinernema hermaphroditum TaxID=289476 RepID=A0AA39LSF6_9BILA|nr:hypothetical protein QR680_003652 [Steinernema hermaphroditum]
MWPTLLVIAVLCVQVTPFHTGYQYNDKAEVDSLKNKEQKRLVADDIYETRCGGFGLYSTCTQYYHRNCSNSPNKRDPAEYSFLDWKQSYANMKDEDDLCHSFGFYKRCMRNGDECDEVHHEFARTRECITATNKDRRRLNEIFHCGHVMQEVFYTLQNCSSFVSCYLDLYSTRCGNLANREVCERYSPRLRQIGCDMEETSILVMTGKWMSILLFVCLLGGCIAALDYDYEHDHQAKVDHLKRTEQERLSDHDVFETRCGGYTLFFACTEYYNYNCSNSPSKRDPAEYTTFEEWKQSYEDRKDEEDLCHSFGFYKRCMRNGDECDEVHHEFARTASCVEDTDKIGKHTAEFLVCRELFTRAMKTHKNCSSVSACYYNTYSNHCGSASGRMNCEKMSPVIRFLGCKDMAETTAVCQQL